MSAALAAVDGQAIPAVRLRNPVTFYSRNDGYFNGHHITVK